MLGNLCDVSGARVGHATDEEGLTGCTVVLFDRSAVMGADVRGGNPVTRQADALNPMNIPEQAQGLLLTGGSTYGLAAAEGVMRYLEEANGAPEEVYVPTVPGAVIFDLRVGSHRARPGPDMGYKAAAAARSEQFAQGNVGAGTGATAAKMLGTERSMKGGVGSFSVELAGGLIVAALVILNPAGEVRDPKNGSTIAGPRLEDGTMADSMSLLAQGKAEVSNGENTTIGLVATNAKLTEAQATRLAWMSHDGLARAIHPVHTLFDGDAMFAAATGEVEVSDASLHPPINVVGSWGAYVVQEAVLAAAWTAEGIPGIPAASDLPGARERPGR